MINLLVFKDIYYAYIAISALLVILIIILVTSLVKKNKINKVYQESKNKIISLVGGLANIKSYEAKLSRFELILNDPTIIDIQGLKENSQGVSKINNKITLVLGKEMSSELSNELKKIITKER